MPLRNYYVILVASLIGLLCNVTARQNRNATVISEAIGLIDRHYVDEVDDRKLLELAVSGITQSLDQHSQFIPEDAYDSFEDYLQQEFAGIGIILEGKDESQPVRVVTPLIGSPALRAGMLPEDQIIAVNGEDVSSMPLSEVTKRLRGPVDESVTVTLRRNQDQLVTIQVRRGQISIESVLGYYRDKQSRWVFRIASDPQIAYVRITSFGEKTASEVRKVLTDLDNDFDGLVLDLRGNAGGLLNAAIEICDLFLASGTIVSIRGRNGVETSISKASDEVLVKPDIPIVVLIDSDSASASEIVAACLQDHNRATIAGTRSYGKGTVQNILMMEYGRSALKLTTARYYRPNGQNIHRKKGVSEDEIWGVMPNENLTIKLDKKAHQRLIKRLRETTYPVINPKTSSEDTSVSEGKTAPQAKDLLEADPQLQRAVEHLQQQTQS